ncbi:transglycosylase SLT domain-containing protein [Aliivibrio finisterrensis]|uniref:Transglycosylase SLT domain protein n=1 Tax=Aliivibrio finisterrensis TaxID=511998 RepID=A0ABY0I8E9_9GAMM|nr:transglycosylase SLT domain-containing protein [Aliivibrio finisterrensis]RYU63796.1 transglycosylase SLT domain protein [Aliivibrio finisterrensis]RYU82732.1 transglycosylase SLT domain protein [Aliivibrio finisterrensis]
MDIPIDNTITSMDLAFYEYKANKGEKLATCVIKAARHYKIHPDYIYTIAKQEAGTTGEYRRNKSDGTHDIGQMQINYETWAEEFLRLGFKVDWSRVLYDLCDNVFVGTKIIELRQGTAKNALTAMANYHWFVNAKNKAPHFVYRKHITKKYKRLQKEKERFNESNQLVMNR